MKSETIIVVSTILLLVLAVIKIASMQYYPGCDSFYFLGEAISWPIAVIIIYILSFISHEKTKKILYFRIVIFGVFWLTMSNLLDELFFDPLRLGSNEIFFSIIILTYVLFKIKNVKRNNGI